MMTVAQRATHARSATLDRRAAISRFCESHSANADPAEALKLSESRGGFLSLIMRLTGHEAGRKWVRIAALLTVLLFASFLLLARGRLW
jgi:hypothetical protein